MLHSVQHFAPLEHGDGAPIIIQSNVMTDPPAESGFIERNKNPAAESCVCCV